MTNLGRTDLVELLLKHGASPNLHAAEDNVTPLHEAASAGFIDVVKLLVARGADTKVRQRRHNSLLGFLAVVKTKNEV